MSKHVFGPVPSRRLGFSLGVDPIPRKYCNFDCIYCQVGKTTHTEAERRSFFDRQELVSEVLLHLEKAKAVDVITFSGSGEPTLNKDVGWMIRELKRRTETPVAVITNGSLLHREDVREDLSFADIVLPSLDAVTEETFTRINRPHPSISVDDIVKGLQVFRSAYKGKIWLEIMFAKEVNDGPDELERFRRVLEGIAVDKIQLNTITRPAPGEGARPLEASMLARIGRMFGNRCEVIAGFDKRSEALGIDDWVARVLDILERRALTIDDVASVTGIARDEAADRLRRLESQQLLQTVRQGDILFYVHAEKSDIGT
jgi:wyosine [tRNA(Phe)-imidazoG37] synthetase (radical SAM superfamily)